MMETLSDNLVEEQKPLRTADLGEWESHLTDVGMLVSGLLGIALVLVFYFALVIPARQTYFGQIFLGRGWVTKLEAFLAMWAVSFMALKCWHISRQQRLTAQPLFSTGLTRIHGTTETQSAIRHLQSLGPTLGCGVLYRRVRHLLGCYSKHPSREAVCDLHASLAAAGASKTENTYSMLRVMIWAIPIVGFIGTVIGLGGAVGKFSSSLPEATDFDKLKGLLAGVTAGLSIAFDATFVALLISLLLMFPASAIEKREFDLMANIDEHCHRDVLGRLVDVDVAGQTDDLAAKIAQAVTRVFDEQQRQVSAWWENASRDSTARTQEAVSAMTGAISAVQAAAQSVNEAVTAAAAGAKSQRETLTADILKAASLVLERQREQTAQWWIQINAEVTASIRASMSEVAKVSGEVRSAAGSLESAVSNASRSAHGISDDINAAKIYAGDASTKLAEASQQADRIATSLTSAAAAAGGVVAGLAKAQEHAAAIEQSSGTAKSEFVGVAESATLARQKLQQASEDAQRLREEINAAIEASVAGHHREIQNQVTEMRSRATDLTSAVERMAVIARQVKAVAGIGEPGNGEP